MSPSKTSLNYEIQIFSTNCFKESLVYKKEILYYLILTVIQIKIHY